MLQIVKQQNACGLAAPQVGISKQLVVVALSAGRDLPPNVSPLPATVLFNPSLRVLSTRKYHMWESCLSVPGYYGRVVRHNDIEVQFIDAQLRLQAIRSWGFIAALLQHELDHLDGYLLLDRIANPAVDLLNTKRFEQYFTEQMWNAEEGGYELVATTT